MKFVQYSTKRGTVHPDTREEDFSGARLAHERHVSIKQGVTQASFASGAFALAGAHQAQFTATRNTAVFATSYKHMYIKLNIFIMKSFTSMNPMWKHPFTAIVSGPTGCGKTVFTFKFISEAINMISPPPEKIVYCYGEYQPIFNEYPNVIFNEGLPDIAMFDGKERTLLILDDLMTETNDSVSNIFTKVSHHRNVSVLYLTQNLFYKSKQNRTMSLNAHYIVLFKNPRDAVQVATLARQMYPGQSKFLVEAFKDATEKPFGYLLLDLKPDTDEKYRVRTCIFPDEKQYVYLPK